MNVIDATVRELAERPYRTHVVADTCDGEPCFVAYNDELPGCIAQGVTWRDAVRALDDARTSYIAASLKRGMTVPAPAAILNKAVATLQVVPRIPAVNGDFHAAAGPTAEKAMAVQELVAA